jgi:hypothetical protein
MNLKLKRLRDVSAKQAERPGLRVTESECVELLKQRLLRDRLASVADPELRRWLVLAAEDSAAVAWTTPFPLLVLPELIEERARAAQVRVERQRNILQRGRPQRTLAA